MTSVFIGKKIRVKAVTKDENKCRRQLDARPEHKPPKEPILPASDVITLMSFLHNGEKVSVCADVTQVL